MEAEKTLLVTVVIALAGVMLYRLAAQAVRTDVAIREACKAYLEACEQEKRERAWLTEREENKRRALEDEADGIVVCADGTLLEATPVVGVEDGGVYRVVNKTTVDTRGTGL
jgi:hypothetical protein